MKLVRSSLSIVCGLPCVTVRSAPAIVFSGPAQRSLMLWPARSPSRQATLSIESSDSFVASTAASIATGWSEPVPGRELHPLKSSAFSRRTVSPTIILRPHQLSRFHSPEVIWKVLTIPPKIGVWKDVLRSCPGIPWSRICARFWASLELMTSRPYGPDMNIPPLAIHAVSNGEKAVEALVI